MRKSVFEKGVYERVVGADLLGFATQSVVAHIVAAAVAEREAAGVVWDPDAWREIRHIVERLWEGSAPEAAHLRRLFDGKEGE